MVAAALILAGAPKLHPVRYVANSSDLSAQVVIVAHEDDWQLFMGDVITQRRTLASRTIFIYLTAGDDGRDSTYWRTRERAALASTLLGTAPAEGENEGCKFVPVGSHSIWMCRGDKVESYFMRLPDGRRTGRGFAEHQFESLWKVKRARNTRISSIDGSSVYNGWNDLVSTINGIVGDSGKSQVFVHANDPSVVINPHDHTDHRVAGLLAEQLRREHHWMAFYYVGYALATRADNLSSSRRQAKTSLFLAYDREMTRVRKDWSAYREHPNFYTQCMSRTYRRTPRSLRR
ncbi:MAG TPA: PIG-L family deacetylase [Gemmatimonadaceae bacterium]|nr:PIG-L family deacetylase [Gemmatimonadaceae bacterium]